VVVVTYLNTAAPPELMGFQSCGNNTGAPREKRGIIILLGM